MNQEILDELKNRVDKNQNLLYFKHGENNPKRSHLIVLLKYIVDYCYICKETFNEKRNKMHPAHFKKMGFETIDHFIPRIKGGDYRLNNIRLCCSKCNSDKGALDWEEFLAVKEGRASRLDIKYKDEYKIYMKQYCERKNVYKFLQISCNQIN